MEEKPLGSYQSLERRRYVRFTCTMDIFADISYGRDDEYVRHGGSGYLSIPGPERQKAKVLDLSLGGAKVEVKVPIKASTIVAIRIKTPHNTFIKGKAKIAWAKKAERKPNVCAIGMEFEPFGWRQRFRLKKLIKQELRTQPGQ